MNIKYDYKYHYFYKITNLINNHFYYGVHNTNNLDDGYMGSGVRLQYAYKKYGIENFKKEILKYFDTKEEAFEYESNIVNENLVYDDNCYNLSPGGKGGFIPNIKDFIRFNPLKGKLCVKYKNTKEYFLIDKNEYDSNVYDTNWTNRHHKEESCQKIRKTLTPKESKNNHIWVNDGNGNVKYLDKRKLNEYLKNGWQLGRKGYKPRKNCQGKKI
jgi:hypothetical protein